MIDKLIKQLEQRGYKKCEGNDRGSTFGYWKPFGGRAYQVVILIYAWPEIATLQWRDNGRGFEVYFKFVLGNDGPYSRWDMTICDDKMAIPKFEKICKAFYEGVVLV